MSDASKVVPVNPKDLIGVTKAPLRLVPPALLIQVADVMALGAKKYGPYNWRRYPVKLSVYLEAIQRHLLAVLDGEWLDPESGAPHVAHIAAGVGIILDALALEQLEEDWPIEKGPAALLLAARAAKPAVTVDPSPPLEEPSYSVSGPWSQSGAPRLPLRNVPAPEDKLPLDSMDGSTYETSEGRSLVDR